MNSNRVYLELLADLMPVPQLIEYIRQCYRFKFNLEDEEKENV